jgi:glycerol-3-phosphate acyltransferase PlsY
MNVLIIFPVDNNYISIYFTSFLLGFILGSIPFGFIIARLKKVDIRNFGSKNIGFANASRAVGFWSGIPVLILDIAKGFLPTFFALKLGLIPVIVGLSAVLGHSFTPWLAFRGGKGVATTIGVMLALMPYALLSGLGIFIVFVISFSYISLASMAFALSLPFFVLILYSGNIVLLTLSLVIAFLVLLRHKDNIKRIINKTEPKVSIPKFLKI